MKHAIILAGGAGTRFWPLSRASKPKQLLNLLSKKTLLEQTIERVEPIVDSVVISTGKELETAISNVTDKRMIIEPARRDTAAAIGLVATQFKEEDLLLFLPSDAYIKPVEKFRKSLERAMELATDGIVVLGIEPTTPATGYGYIEPGTDNRIKNFHEKPNEDKAKEYLKNGFLWNAGIFVCKTSVMLELFKKHAPNIHEKLLAIKKTGDIENIYPTIEKISFDYAIMEKAEKIYYTTADFYWNDIGSYDALLDIVQEENVILKGEAITLNSKGNVLHTNKTLALIDCQDLVIIDTEDALLVVPKESVQKIKTLVENHVKEELR